MKTPLSDIIGALEVHGYAVAPNFLTTELVFKVQNEMRALRDQDLFQRAQIGRASGVRLEDEVRRDWTKWFEPADLSETQKEIWSVLEGLRGELNRSLFLGLWDFEGHYAVYPPGAFYKTHLDRFKNDSKRTVSVVFFFNSDWDLARDGGGLRLEVGPDQIVSPEAGTLVCFLSDRIPHEVLETKRERFSFAGWMRTRS